VPLDDRRRPALTFLQRNQIGPPGAWVRSMGYQAVTTRLGQRGGEDASARNRGLEQRATKPMSLGDAVA
jgi:hypothetical protein